MKIKKVTLTGADDSVDTQPIIEITKAYPYIEWGILLSRSQMGGTRFPSAKWMTKLSYELDDAPDIDLAGHLCGGWLNDLMDTGDISFIDQIPLWNKFKRIQLNFHGHPRVLTDKTIESLRSLCWGQGKQFIIQMDGVNNNICEQLLNAGVIASGLFDLSHGGGVLPQSWPEEIPGILPGIYHGRSGGLGSVNLAEQLPKIEASVGNCPIWVDMETKLYINNGTQFSYDECINCLELCKPYV